MAAGSHYLVEKKLFIDLEFSFREAALRMEKYRSQNEN